MIAALIFLSDNSNISVILVLASVGLSVLMEIDIFLFLDMTDNFPFYSGYYIMGLWTLFQSVS